ncbi:hypothetical protein TNCT_297201, partial [Trichonephila clavata]
KMKTSSFLLFIAVALTTVQAGEYCPRMLHIKCFRQVNQCCRDADCYDKQICCYEPCGNICRSPVPFETNGLRHIPCI